MKKLIICLFIIILLINTNPENLVSSQSSTVKFMFSLTHDETVTKAYWNNDNSRLITQTSSAIYIWDSSSGELLESIDNNKLRWNHQKTAFLSFNTGGSEKLRIWHAESDLSEELDIRDSIYTVYWSPDDSLFLVETETDKYELFDAETYQKVFSVDMSANDYEYYWPALFSPDNDLLFILGTLDDNAAFNIYDIDANSSNFGKLLAHLIQPRSGETIIDNHYIYRFDHQGHLTITDIDPDSNSFGQVTHSFMYSNVETERNWMINDDYSLLLTWSEDKSLLTLWDIDPASPEFGEILAETTVVGGWWENNQTIRFGYDYIRYNDGPLWDQESNYIALTYNIFGPDAQITFLNIRNPEQEIYSQTIENISFPMDDTEWSPTRQYIVWHSSDTVYLIDKNLKNVSKIFSTDYNDMVLRISQNDKFLLIANISWLNDHQYCAENIEVWTINNQQMIANISNENVCITYFEVNSSENQILFIQNEMVNVWGVVD